MQASQAAVTWVKGSSADFRQIYTLGKVGCVDVMMEMEFYIYSKVKDVSITERKQLHLTVDSIVEGYTEVYNVARTLLIQFNL